MDELNEDELRELEEKLYSQIHHQTSEHEPIISEESPNVAVSKKGNANRYWVNKDDRSLQKQKPNVTQKEHQQTNDGSVHIIAKDGQIRNPFVAIPKQRNQQLNKSNQLTGPFQRQAQKLKRATQYENKKQKAKNARSSMLKRPKIIETVELDSSEDEFENDEVIVVPLPPTPVYNIDDSDEDENSKKSDDEKETNRSQEATNQAFATPKSKKSQPPAAATANEQSSDVPSRCNSPNSVMSQDDFIGQTDRQRLLKNTQIAEDSDMHVLTNNADSFLEPPTPSVRKMSEQEISNEIECIGTFIKPSGGITPRGNNKQCYRVDQSGFRAIDVYESESDIVSDGVYSKGGIGEKLNLPNTTIRNIDKSSSSELDDVTTVQTKTKRFRKRRASSSHGGHSGGGGIESSDSDVDDGVEPSGVPFISRGPAVERCKSKKFRKTSTSQSQMSDSVFLATLNSLAQGSNNEDDDSDNDRFPTARDIAATVLNQEEQIPATNVEPIVKEPKIEAAEPEPEDEEEREEEEGQSATESKDLSETAVPAEIADDIEKLFDKINASKNDMEGSDESDDCEISGVTQINNVPTDSETTTTTTMAEESLEQSAPGEQESNTDGGVKYFIGYSPANNSCKTDGFGWNEEMRRFYNFSWGGENFREDVALRRLCRDKRLWVISDLDRNSMKTNRDRREKCINCYSFGHTRFRCPKPRKPIICYMCGESGHQESRCPNTRCLRCGSKTSIYSQSCRKCIYWNNRTCPICQLPGHSLNDCPDKWRRYHSTTKPNALLESRVIYNKRRYCCFCGRRGHLSDECKNALYRTEYPPISSEIKSHEKAYHDVMTSPFHQPEIPCRLLFDPKIKANFQLAAKTTPKKAYGRFLCAVGLGHLLGASSSRGNKTKSPSEATVSTTIPTPIEVNCPTTTSPDQVPEVSESTNGKSLKISESLQMPPPQIQEHATTPTANETIAHDSDSNYSFSDHFELPTSSSSSQQCVKKSSPLPDFISINTNNNTGSQKKYKKLKEKEKVEEHQSKELVQLDKNSDVRFGISAKFVEFFSDDDDDDHDEDDSAHIIAAVQPEQSNNIQNNEPCEAKIYISNEHSKYFQSALGQQYLSKIMSDNNLNGRLNKTIVGYALFINGLPADQEKLQSELEMKFQMLDDDKHERSAKVPRNVDTLITRLRSGINQLYTNLGNATELFNHLNKLDKQRDKCSIKATERIRKSLNMIFLGQAGLSDGDKHIETLINGLQTLLNDFKGYEKTPDDLRNQIDFSYRMLFTPFRQKDYSQLLLAYQNIPPGLRNRLPQLKLQPSLLGKPQLNIFVNDDKRSKGYGGINNNNNNNNNNSNNNNINNNNKQNLSISSNSSNIIEEGTLLLNVVASEKYQQSDDRPSTSSREHFPTIENLKKRNAINNNEFLDEDCRELLSEIIQSSNSIEKTIQHTDTHKPSTFWSRESLRLLMQLIRWGDNNPNTLKRLTAISKKAASGDLSYSDYRIVLELYNITVQIKKK